MLGACRRPALCRGHREGHPPPHPPNRVSGPGRVPPALPGSAPLQEAAAGLPPSPARGGGGPEGPLEPESGMVEEFPERARERLGASARARRGPASGRGRGRGPRPAPQGRAQPRATRSDRPLPCQGFLCFALAFCALVQVAVWGVHSPSQVSAPPHPIPPGEGPSRVTDRVRGWVCQQPVTRGGSVGVRGPPGDRYRPQPSTKTPLPCPLPG